MDSEQIRSVRALRAKLDHPVIDGDGHLIEAAPLFNDYLRQVGGDQLVERYHRELREHPDHWNWIHRRWKTRPPGEARIY